jgi:hypothetical protein
MGMVAAVEARIGVDGETAVASGGGDVAAAGQVFVIAGLSEFASHRSLLDGMIFGNTCQVLFAKVLKMRRMQGKSAHVIENAGS